MNEPDQQGELFDFGAELGSGSPLVYLAMPLSHLPDDHERERVELLADKVEQALRDECAQSVDRWQVRVHSPVKRSAPWKPDEWTSEGVYKLNSDQVWREADALVIIAACGGGIGIGQELEWACDLQIPVLYLHPAAEPVSRQIEGAATAFEIEISAYKSPEDLRDRAGRWLASRRADILDGPRRRRNRCLLFGEQVRQMREVWESLDFDGRAAACVTARLTPNRIGRLLGDPLALAAASARVKSLESALGLPEVGSEELSELKPRQLETLIAAALENDWNPEAVLLLRQKAREELAREEIRRLPLTDTRSWVELYRRWFGRDR